MLENGNIILASRLTTDSESLGSNSQKAGEIISISEILQGKNTVALGGHIRPDGDCVGSCVGLYLYIRKNYPQIEVHMYLENVPPVFQLLVGVDKIKNQLMDLTRPYDLFITLDCAEVERLGFSRPAFLEAKMTFCIDHHVSNSGFADVNYIVPEASSTSELVYHLLRKPGPAEDKEPPSFSKDKTTESVQEGEMGDRIDLEIASALFLGIVHDTGVFRFSNTTAETMEVAAALLRKGVIGDEIIEKTFYERTYLQTKIIGKALAECELILDGKCLYYVLTAKDMKEYNVTSSDLDGIVSQLWLTKDIEIAIFMYELEGYDFKVSMRSSERVDVSLIAKRFGGGGHKRAAGFEMMESSERILQLVCEEVKKYLS